MQSSEVVCLPQEFQTHNEAQDLLLLQDYVHRLTNTLRTLEDTHAVLWQTELLAGVINEQDCRDIRTACCCIRSLRIQDYLTEDLNTADTSCLSRTSLEHFEDRPGPWAEKNARIPAPRN